MLEARIAFRIRPLRQFRHLPFLLGWLVLATLAGAARAQSFGGPAHVTPVLAAQTQGAAPGSTVYVALIQTIDKG